MKRVILLIVMLSFFSSSAFAMGKVRHFVSKITHRTNVDGNQKTNVISANKTIVYGVYKNVSQFQATVSK